MHISPNERLGLFIDGPNLNAACRALAFDVDFKRLLNAFRQLGQLVRANYYTVATEGEEWNSLRPLLDWLEYNGYTTVSKQVKPYSSANGHRRGIEIDLAVDAMRLKGSLNHVVLISGNGDFAGLVSALKHHGKRVTVVSTLLSQPQMIADELRREADQYVDLMDLKIQVERVPRKPGGT
jgi:uncharacterized LabA/DUF88 family protein